MENTNNNNQGTIKRQPGRNTVIGKHQLIIVVSSEKEIASQLFNYDDIREIRLSLTNLEVTVLMNYDTAYHRIFKIVTKSQTADEIQKAEQVVLKFYNDLINASMRFTKEELENIKKQQEEMLKKIKAEQTETSNSN